MVEVIEDEDEDPVIIQDEGDVVVESDSNNDDQENDPDYDPRQPINRQNADQAVRRRERREYRVRQSSVEALAAFLTEQREILVDDDEDYLNLDEFVIPSTMDDAVMTIDRLQATHRAILNQGVHTMYYTGLCLDAHQRMYGQERRDEWLRNAYELFGIRSSSVSFYLRLFRVITRYPMITGLQLSHRSFERNLHFFENIHLLPDEDEF